MPHPPIITLLTDFGLDGHYAAAMKGVILGICPDARVVDISHGVKPYQVAEGAYTLAQAWSCFPLGTIHVAVVDPGVGSERRAILAEAGGHFFIGPDNGIFSFVFEAVAPHSVRQLTEVEWFRGHLSRTFHGRDLFAPVAAHLASGVQPDSFGPKIDTPVLLPASRPTQISQNEWRGVVLHIDHFGNIVTNFRSDQYSFAGSRGYQMKISGSLVLQYYSSYAIAPSDELFLIPGSAGFLEVSLNQSHAASLVGAQPGDSLTLLVL